MEPAAGAVREGTGLRPVTSRLARSGLCALLAIALPGSDAAGQLQPNPVVVFETEKGAIEMEADAARAPISAANFLKYVEAKLYDGGSINGAAGQHGAARRRDPGHSVPERRRAAP